MTLIAILAGAAIGKREGVRPAAPAAPGLAVSNAKARDSSSDVPSRVTRGPDRDRDRGRPVRGADSDAQRLGTRRPWTTRAASRAAEHVSNRRRFTPTAGGAVPFEEEDESPFVGLRQVEAA